MEDKSEYDDGDIVVIEGVDAIRRRTDMFLGKLERDDLFDELIFEALCHAIDEALDDRCKHINIDIDRAGIVSIQYDACMSLELKRNGKPKADSYFGELYACHNLKKHIEVGSKYCRHGLYLLNAVCSEFKVDIVERGKWGKQTYIKGKVDQEFIIADTNEIDRTHFQFRFDEELLGKHTIHLDRLQLKADELMQDLGVKVSISHVLASI
jgi:DNA gyrase/topoisomerase IV subunit B